MRWKTGLLWVAFLGLTSVVYLAAVQFALATFFPAPIIPKGQSFYQADDHLGWKLIPNKESGRTRVGKVFLDEKVNSAGFRDVERSPAKPKGAVRIVVLGDSFCDQLEIPLRQLFPRVLETKLNFQRSISVEVINLGVAGFGTAQAYLAFKHHGAQYRPNLVILAFFMGNDVYDNSAEWQAQHINIQRQKRPFFVLHDGSLKRLERVSTPEAARDTIVQKIRRFAYRFLPDVAYRVRNNLLVEKLLRRGERTSGPPTHLALYLDHYPPVVEKAWEVTNALILKLARELEQAGIDFIVVLIPNEFEFRADQWERALQDYPEYRSLTFDLRKPERILTNFLAKINVDYILLRPGFEKHSRETGRDLHFHGPVDNHWNADGHALAAEIIYQKLLHSELLEPTAVRR